jgi:site-specific DNA recombinase
MQAAIYARKSTEQNGVTEANKSVTRQKELARAFAAARGWAVVAEFEDDGISGAEFERRPGFQAMLAAARRGNFHYLVVAEQKALGRESYETQHTIKRLAQAGVDVWSYMDGKSLTPRNAMDKAMSSLRAFGDEAHREDTARRTHEAHRQKVQRGFVVGGRVFGYRNEHVYSGADAHGNPLREGTRRVINQAEAAVVRRVFELYAAGEGLKKIAKRLTAERAPQPLSPTRHDGLTVPGWAPSTVRSILCRELYRGVIVWNRSRKRDDWGQISQRPRPTDEWTRTVDERLRIVPEDLWTRVASRRADTEGRTIRFDSGRICGGPPRTAAQNLLAGLATCGLCGGGLVVETNSRKNGPRVPEYICQRRRSNSSCTNRLCIPVPDMNEAVLRAVEEHVFTPEAIEQVIALTERDELRERQDLLRAEQKDVERRIARLTAAVETDEGTGLVSLVAKLRQLEQRQASITRELESLTPVPRLPQAVVQNRLDEWRRLLRASTTQGRAVLQRVIQGRITFTPTGTESIGLDAAGTVTVSPCAPTGYDFQAATRFDKLFAGVAFKRPAGVPYTTEGCDGIGPDDTFDADYGALLERAYGTATWEGLRPQRDSNPCFGLERATSWASGRWGREVGATRPELNVRNTR